MAKLLGISGSLRAASTNTKLVQTALASFGGAGHEIADLNLPLYDGDLEERSMPEGVLRLAAQIKAADGIVISTPEYNGNIPGVLKNALDWVSRVEGHVMTEKPVAIMSAAAGRAGGARAQYSLRLCLAAFRVHITPGPEVAIAASFKAFGDDGQLLDETATDLLGTQMQALRAQIG